MARRQSDRNPSLYEPWKRGQRVNAFLLDVIDSRLLNKSAVRLMRANGQVASFVCPPNLREVLEGMPWLTAIQIHCTAMTILPDGDVSASFRVLREVE